jgi:hypothetical protein
MLRAEAAITAFAFVIGLAARGRIEGRESGIAV